MTSQPCSCHLIKECDPTYMVSDSETTISISSYPESDVELISEQELRETEDMMARELGIESDLKDLESSSVTSCDQLHSRYRLSHVLKQETTQHRVLPKVECPAPCQTAKRVSKYRTSIKESSFALDTTSKPKPTVTQTSKSCFPRYSKHRIVKYEDWSSDSSVDSEYMSVSCEDSDTLVECDKEHFK